MLTVTRVSHISQYISHTFSKLIHLSSMLIGLPVLGNESGLVTIPTLAKQGFCGDRQSFAILRLSSLHRYDPQISDGFLAVPWFGHVTPSLPAWDHFSGQPLLVLFSEDCICPLLPSWSATVYRVSAGVKIPSFRRWSLLVPPCVPDDYRRSVHLDW